MRQVTRRVEHFRSVRFVSVETRAKLAVRIVALTTKLKSWQLDDPRDPPTGPYAALPEPLRSVAVAMPDGSAGQATCDLLASSLGAPVAPTLLEGADLVVMPRPEIDPAAHPLTPGSRVPSFVASAATLP